MRAFGFSSDDFFIRLSDRNVWLGFLETQGIDMGLAPEFLQIIDKLEREKPEVTDQKQPPGQEHYKSPLLPPPTFNPNVF
jgi:histidyl-tRNA synthetase